MASDEYAAQRRRIARGWIRAGQLERAEQAVATDSSVDGLAVAGQIALYRGDLALAVSRLQAAGPYAGTREEATARTALLALLQPIEAESLPALGTALFQLERGDSAAAATALERAAAELPPGKGGAEVRLLAGRIHRAGGRSDEAERLFRLANIAEAPSTAPAAALELGRLLIALGRNAEAVPVLEHMILTYTTSALVPQARRALDEARGAIPQT
jgi:tetratricopeptide (TPR) repeat protein